MDMDDPELGSLADIVSARRAAGQALVPLWLWVLAAIAVGLVLSALLGVAGFRASASVGHAVGHAIAWVFGFGIIALVLNSPRWKRHRGVIRKIDWLVPGSGKVRHDPLAAQDAPAPAPDQDRLIAPRTRLVVCAVLDCVDSMTIDRLAKTLNVSPSDLAHEITTLTRAGCIEIRAHPNDSGQQWISLSAIGRSALANRENALLEAALRRR
jgi:hypothetical protein